MKTTEAPGFMMYTSHTEWVINPLSANPTKLTRPDELLSVSDHFVRLAPQGLNAL